MISFYFLNILFVAIIIIENKKKIIIHVIIFDNVFSRNNTYEDVYASNKSLLRLYILMDIYYLITKITCVYYKIPFVKSML